MPDSSQIVTQRLILEPFTEKFLTERYVSWLNDPEVVKYSENRHRKHTIESCREYLESFKGTPDCFWAICLKENMSHIGNINAHVNVPNSIADVGIMIGEKDCHGKGFASEAWRAVLHFLLDDMKIRKVTAGTMSANLPMLKIMQNSGMLPDGIRKNHYILDGSEVDIVHMAAGRNITSTI